MVVDVEDISFFKVLSDGQLRAQVQRCLNCEGRPCRTACPSHCDPSAFITAIRNMLPSDFARAAKMILTANPFGAVCGAVCPDKFCQKACSRSKLDCSIDIPAVQATIIHKARTLNVLPELEQAKATKSEKVAIVGAGAAGLTAALTLAQSGITCDVFEKESEAGGALALIPEGRLPREFISQDISRIVDHPLVTLHTSNTADINTLSGEYDAVVVSSGAQKERSLKVLGSEHAVFASQFLRNPTKFVSPSTRRISIIGGGAVAVDCAIKSKLANPSSNVSLVYRRGLGDMPITPHERSLLIESGSDVIPRTVVSRIEPNSISTMRVEMGERGSNAAVPVEGSQCVLPSDLVILALGSSSDVPSELPSNVFVCGDAKTGPSTVVECVASGKKTAGEVVARLGEAFSKDCGAVDCSGCEEHIPGFTLPVPVTSSTFGFPLRNPFILSAAPATDGVEECRAALKAGWAGVVLKTAFHGLPIHVPDGYMAFMDDYTYGNCDNVSGRCLSEVVADIKVLKEEFPDRLISGSTGGSMSGDDEADRASWQKHTRMLEEAGADLVEYSLSCPQGAEGSQGNEGTMVSQSPGLSKKVIAWVMECSDPNIPKLFKLTGAVTDPMNIMKAALEVFEQYPHKKAGVTLANSFPSLDFVEGKQSSNGKYRQARVVGIHGRGIAAISNLTLANVASTPWKRGMLELSASGGAMDYRSAADFMALGASTVQFCTLPTKDGLRCIQELENGLSHYMAARGFSSVEELIGCLLPEPVTDFMELTAVKKISQVNDDSCIKCMNCVRCPYLAISLVDDVLVTDPAKCIGCSICAAKCPTFSIDMRVRTEEEAKVQPH